MPDVHAERRRVLEATKRFARLPSDLVDQMLARMTERRFESGQTVIRQDDPGDAIFVVMEGKARVRVRDDRGVQHDVGILTWGDVLGEMALFTGAPRSADVVALTPLRLMALEAKDFHELAWRHPELGVMLSNIIADRLGGPRDILGDKVLKGNRILRRIGEGGMSVVYEAEELETGRHVALKMMSHRLVYDSRSLVRFREEAEISETLEHDNIVRVYGRFSAYGTHFLVLEFCNGPGLDELLRRGVPIAEKHVRPIIGQLAAALRYVHGRSLIHRDVKASNVRLVHPGRAKLMDFGLAKPTLDLDDRTETHVTALVGTPSYMAPEQFDEGDLDHRVDIYALAGLAYRMLSADRPFKSKGLARLVREKFAFRVPLRERIGHGISAEMHEFLALGLRADRDERLDSLDACLGWAGPIDVAALEG